jgi:multiple sugar transport system substrate-binding protein
MLCFILVLNILFSCSSNNEVNTNTETEKLPPVDMGGYEFVFLAMTDFETYFYPEVGVTAIGDKILARYKETENKFNCVMNVSARSADAPTQYIQASALSGEKFADLLDTHASVLYTNREYFVPLNGLENFDINNKKWGPPQYLDTAEFYGKNYGFMAYYWGMPYPQYIGNLYFLPKLMQEFDLPNPQEVYEKGNWNWDSFREYSRKLTTVDNADKNNNTYGFVLSDEMKLPRAFVISNGAEQIKFDEASGKYVYGLTDKRAQDALTFINDMLKEGIGFYTQNDDFLKAFTMFINRKVGFFEAFNKTTFINDEIHLASLKEDYSWLPYPCGPEGTYGKSTAQFWLTARFLGLLDNKDEEMLNYDVTLINDIFEPLKDETTESWKTYIQRNFFYDDLSFKYYIELFEGGHPDYSAVAYEAVWTTIPGAYRKIFLGKQTVAEALNSIENTVNSALDTTLN